MDNRTKISKISEFVSDLYEKKLQYHVERFSNNKRPKFTDEQMITMYIYCTTYEKRLTIRDMYDFTRTYLRDIFVNLPSYVAVCNRIARLAAAFKELLSHVAHLNKNIDDIGMFSVMDSMPIITCSGKRKGKVAPEITDKGFCSSKSMHYYGLKLHTLAFHNKGTLPTLDSMVITPASENDLNVFRDYWNQIPYRIFFGDKIYQCADNELFMKKYNSELLSPVKYPRGVEDCIKQFNKASDDAFNRNVSSIRQPIEAFFSWLIERTNIQRASKVRSTNGLLAFVYGKLAAVLLVYKFFKP